MRAPGRGAEATEVRIPSGGATLEGTLVVPAVPEGSAGPRGIVLFAHGSGSGRHSPRNRFVARALEAEGLATLLFDLLTEDEEQEDERTRRLRFDVALLARRLADAARFAEEEPTARGLRVGFFGASTGAAAALLAAVDLGDAVGAVVSRGGRPDLAGDALPLVRAPTLLLVGALDGPVVEMNRAAHARLGGEKELRVVPGATHLFPEPGALEEVASLAARWFVRHLGGGRGRA